MTGRRSFRRTVAVVFSLGAGLAVGLLVLWRQPTSVPIVPISSERLGTTWEVKLDARRELRVWRDQTTLVLQCPGEPAANCRTQGLLRVAEVPLSVPGEYRAIALPPGSMPQAPQSYEDDVKRARGNGAAYEVLEPLVVQ